MNADWPILKLESIVERVCVGFVGSCNKYYTTPEKGVPMIRTTNLTGTNISYDNVKYISKEFHKKNVKSQLKMGDILIARHGDSGLPAIYETNEDANCLNVVIVKPKDDSDYIDSYFFLYSLKSPFVLHQIKSAIGGTVQGVVNTKVIAKLDIPFPDRHIRKKIATQLHSLDKKIDLNAQINQTLETMAQAIFKSWFVDFEPVKAKIAAIEAGEDPESVNRAAMRAISDRSDEGLDKMQAEKPEEYAQLKGTAELFPAAMWDSELGEIPVGCNPKKVSDFVELAYGKALKKTLRIEGEIPVYGSGGVNGTHNISLVEGPGIIIGRKGTVGSLYWEDKSFYPIDTVFYVKPMGKISLEFAYYLLQTLGLESMNTDAVVPGLNRNNVYRLDVLGFDDNLIAHFTDTVKLIRKMITITFSEISLLDNLRDTLLPKLLSGELSVENIKLDEADA